MRLIGRRRLPRLRPSAQNTTREQIAFGLTDQHLQDAGPLRQRQFRVAISSFPPSIAIWLSHYVTSSPPPSVPAIDGVHSRHRHPALERLKAGAHVGTARLHATVNSRRGHDHSPSNARNDARLRDSVRVVGAPAGE